MIKDEKHIPSMCFRTEIGKCRLACCTTSTKYTGGWTRSLPVPCAAPAAVWVFEAFVNEFWLFATDLFFCMHKNQDATIGKKKNTSHRSTWTGVFCRWEWEPQWTTFLIIEVMGYGNVSEWKVRGREGWEKGRELISGSVSGPREQHATTSLFTVSNRCCLGVSVYQLIFEIRLNSIHTLLSRFLFSLSPRSSSSTTTSN